MSTYYVKRGETRLTLVVPLQLAAGEPTPDISAATMVLVNKTTEARVTRAMQVDSTPLDRVDIFYKWLEADWSGSDLPKGTYRATWELVQSGEKTIAPSVGMTN